MIPMPFSENLAQLAQNGRPRSALLNLLPPAGGGAPHGFGPGGAVTGAAPPAHLRPFPLGGLGAALHGEDFGNGHHGEHGVGGLGGMNEAAAPGRLAALIAAITAGSHGTIGGYSLPPSFGGAEFNFHRPQDILKDFSGGHVVDGLPPDYGPSGSHGEVYSPPRRRQALAQATYPSFQAA